LPLLLLEVVLLGPAPFTAINKPMTSLTVQQFKNQFQEYAAEQFRRHFSSSFHEMVTYSFFPTGKILRATLLFLASGGEEKKLSEINALALAIECHHLYTLIHDDLPCMDNDDFRRGRPSAHKKFNEWKALLCGDALLNYSYYLIAQHIQDPKKAQTLLRWQGKLLGAQGLIGGQYIDLEVEEKKEALTVKEIVHVHELKTARLFQFALLSGALIKEDRLSLTDLYSAYARGYYLGVSFQFIDDYDDWKETIEGPLASSHELLINPWINAFSKTKSFMERHQEKWLQLRKRYPHPLIDAVTESYATWTIQK
jgi:geranylgeranyl pyrophosphate synthase